MALKKEYRKWLEMGLDTRDKLVYAGIPLDKIPPMAVHSKVKQSKCYWCAVYKKCFDHILIDGDEMSPELRKIFNWGPYRINQAKCLKCGDVIRSLYGHDFKYCKCKSIFVDGGSWCPRFGGNPQEMEITVIKFKTYED